IIPHRSNLGNEQAYAPLFKVLGSELGVDFEWIGSKTYDDVIRHITTGRADIGYVGPFAYVDAQDNFGVRLICRTLSKKKVEFYHSMIITRHDSGINSLQELRGKSFSFTDPKSTSGFLFPMAKLKETGLQLKDFSEVRYLKRHANSLLAVHKSHVDAGATSYTAIDKVNIDFDDIKILWKSEPIYRGPWIARKDLPDPLFDMIKKAMLKTSNSMRAEEIFQGLTTKGFIEGKDSDYENVREVVRLMHNQD
ncbi:MAG: phosphate/phosphite/phosphonate ABC transporter substrate-binding protein, partial [bacterium]